mmetsp:Transcript_44945/g.78475  ORF Transcript_44945/g.78475 Transcript_44945/m.78475 type:complete len:908 (-) Transcript_44945:191-2914(-)
MIYFLFLFVLVQQTLILVHSAGTFTFETPELYGINAQKTFAVKGYKVDGKLYIGGHSDGAVGTGAVGGYDMFIRKFPTDDPTQTPTWTQMFGTSGIDYLGDFKVDSNGNLYAVGMCSGTVNSVATKGSGDACIFKIDSTGAVQCSAQYGGSGVDRFKAVALDETNGYFYAVGNTTSAAFDGTSTVGLSVGIWFRFQMSNCAKVGDKYVQSMPVATQRLNFGDILVLSSGETVVGSVMRSPTSLPDTTGFQIAGHTPTFTGNGGCLGLIKVSTTSGNPVPVKALFVGTTGANAGAEISGIALDADENMYLMGYFTATTDSRMLFLKADNQFTLITGGNRASSTAHVRGLALERDPASGVLYFAGSVNANTGGASFVFESVAYTAPITFVLAFKSPDSAFSFQEKLIYPNGGAIEDITPLGSDRFLGVGSSFGDFNGVTGSGIVNMFTAEFTFSYSTMPPSLAPTVIPTAPPSTSSTEAPTLIPTVSPSAAPSLDPTTSPTVAPSSDPTVNPTAGPSTIPTEAPSVAPSIVPTAPTVDPTVNPTAQPSVDPTTAPSAVPTNMPTAAPSVDPSAVPTASPSAMPSAAPTVSPSADPTANPSVVPTANPTVDPTAKPSAAPTVTPSVNPTAQPSVDPSAAPTVAPSANPTVNPTATPSTEPSTVPTTLPTLSPSVTPSASPSAVPTQDPTNAPSAIPTVMPTAAPSVDPSVSPTVVPSVKPTARPTDSTVVNLELAVTQTVNNLDVATYEANRAAYNVTFQQTIAATLDSITPQGITAIRVSARARRVTVHADAEVPQSTLQYTLTMFDAQVEFDVFQAQLVEAVSTGMMDAHFRHYAGMHGIDNSSYFGEAQASLSGDRASSSALTGVMIVGIVIGVLLAISIVGFIVAFFLVQEKAKRPAVSSDAVASV